MIQITCDVCRRDITFTVECGDIQGETPEDFCQRPASIGIGMPWLETYSSVAVYKDGSGGYFIACSVGCSEQAVQDGRVNMEYQDIALVLRGNRWKSRYNRAVRQAQFNQHSLETMGSDIINKLDEADEAKWTV